MSKLKQTQFKRWLRKFLDAKPKFRKSDFLTESGIEISHLYEESNTSIESGGLGFPGEFPFTRGAHPGMYRTRPWTIRQYAGFDSAEASNERYKLLLNNGANALSIAFDLPTQMGRDSDHPLAKGEVGRVGVAIDSVEDIHQLFKDIPLNSVSTSMTINATAPILLAMYQVAAEERDIPSEELQGTVQNDLLKEYIARGTYIYPLDESLRLSVDLMEYCQTEIPNWNTISVSGYHIREAGSSATQELAFTLLNGLTYLELAKKRGLEIDSIAKRFSFFFNCHNCFFEEIAKFRAARRIWASKLKNHFDCKDEKALKLRFHTQTAGSSLTAQQPLVNISRTSVQALAAVLGGTQSLHTSAYDEALGLPGEDAARVSLRVQQYLLEETGVADVVDPLAGSYFIESLTSELETKVEEYFSKVEDLGGMIPAIQAAYPQGEIEEWAWKHQRELENGDRKVVGVNCHQTEQDLKISPQKQDLAIEEKQQEKLKKLKATRNSIAVKTCLAELEERAKGTDNLMPFIVDCVRARSTLGEISEQLRNIWGEHRT